MFYIHQASCISPQQTFNEIDIDMLYKPVEKRLLAIEPVMEGVPASILRRMSKVVRMGIATAMQVLKDKPKPDGIIIGTANSGQEDCVKFLNQIIEYNEGLLTPLNFVQSTPNAVAAQISLLTKNHGYNITHLHLGLAFELAMIDADMMLEENEGHSYLLGAIDDISSYNFLFEEKNGYHKEGNISNKDLYKTDSPGSIMGEAASMFLVNGNSNGAIAKVLGVETLHTADETTVKEKMHLFVGKYLPVGEQIDLLLTGENGDSRFLKYYSVCESLMLEEVSVARFKHMSGEFPTAAGMGLWLACEILQKQSLPVHMVKKDTDKKHYKNILIYNTYKGEQHSIILVAGH